MNDRAPTVRLATAADLFAVAAINAEAGAAVSPLRIGDLTTMKRSATRFWVAEVGGHVAAYLVAFAAAADAPGDEFRWFAARSRDFLYLDQVAVAAAWRRRGLGARLYAKGARWASARGLTALTCEVNLRPENLPSLRFHLRQGFQEVGRMHTIDGRLVSLQSKALRGRPKRVLSRVPQALRSTQPAGPAGQRRAGDRPRGALQPAWARHSARPSRQPTQPCAWRSRVGSSGMRSWTTTTSVPSPRGSKRTLTRSRPPGPGSARQV